MARARAFHAGSPWDALARVRIGCARARARGGGARTLRPTGARKRATVGQVTLRERPAAPRGDRPCGSALVAVLHAADEAAEVLLDEPVAGESALPARGDEPVAAQDAELLRDDRLALPDLLGKGGDVLLAAAEERDDPEPDR